ncbi:isoprenylcysteine carboxylmethyltransferase family protein [Arthrobacter sp. CJ23]|uniref:methyltransferase family protein n=1 Tax=Arthrobacter sp. CJ23 TaxID=2972479 RepID=UPI00215D15D4|nr:isoprenylcysteine carboxylmethyltransferase family protein [Arthrobacter sp. CJ23]UVJ38257.1 isoprenylcysteine carboxylmethyltransferase family protein [Arthrobacter sp. CJ23]
MGAKELLGNVPLPPGQLVGLGADIVLGRLKPARLPGPRTVHRAAGSGLLVAGCAINAWSLLERRRQSSGAFDLERPQSLVVTGPYASSRHPMYVGWWLIHLGLGVLQGSAWAFATTPAAALAEHRGVLAEERTLAESFGHAYAAYAQRVPRYVPGRR